MARPGIEPRSPGPLVNTNRHANSGIKVTGKSVIKHLRSHHHDIIINAYFILQWTALLLMPSSVYKLYIAVTWANLMWLYAISLMLWAMKHPRLNKM